MVISTLLRRGLTVVLGVVALLAASVLYARLFAGVTRQYQPSPDGRNIAEYREYKEGSATTTDVSTVELRSRFNPLRHTVLSGLDYGAKLSLTWIDSHTLLVTRNGCSHGDLQVPCNNCTSLDIIKKEPRWRDISIRYSVE